MKKFHPRIFTSWLWVVLLFAGCGGGGQPLASLLLSTAEVPLPYGALVVVPMRMECLQELPAGPLVLFAHLLDEAGEIVRTFDRPFSVARVQGCVVTTPLTLWQSALSAPLPAGSYRLRVGLTSQATGRIALAVEGVQGRRRSYEVARVIVPESAEPLPSLGFAGAWKESASADERQLPGQRWLEGDGALLVRGMDRQRNLRMSVRLLEAQEHGLKYVFQEGESSPAFTVTAGCNSGSGRFEGAATHDLRVRLLPTSFPADCEVRFESNFTLIDPETLARSTLGVERVTWIDLVLGHENASEQTSPETAGQPQAATGPAASRAAGESAP